MVSRELNHNRQKCTLAQFRCHTRDDLPHIQLWPQQESQAAGGIHDPLKWEVSKQVTFQTVIQPHSVVPSSHIKYIPANSSFSLLIRSLVSGCRILVSITYTTKDILKTMESLMREGGLRTRLKSGCHSSIHHSVRNMHGQGPVWQACHLPHLAGGRAHDHLQSYTH